MRLHQCAICERIDRWTSSWETYGSLLLEENRCDLVARLCSPKCKAEFSRMIKSGAIIPATAKARGMSVTITEPTGYEPQPPQEELLRRYNLRPATPPNEQ